MRNSRTVFPNLSFRPGMRPKSARRAVTIYQVNLSLYDRTANVRGVGLRAYSTNKKTPMQEREQTPLPTERPAGTIYTERIEIDPKNPVTILDGGESRPPYSPKVDANPERPEKDP